MISRPVKTRQGSAELSIASVRAKTPLDAAGGLRADSVVSLESLVDEPVDITSGGRLIAKGEVLALDGSLCIRVTKLIACQEAA